MSKLTNTYSLNITLRDIVYYRGLEIGSADRVYKFTNGDISAVCVVMPTDDKEPLFTFFRLIL